MKNLLIILLSLMALASCQNNHKCLIEGTVGNSDLNGKRIFLVPVFHEDSLGVDSVVIQNNRFQFERNEEFLADIRVDYHFRYGTESLLVVTEPGVVKVVIDSVSSGGGTPQNDSLQVWKELMMQRNSDVKKLVVGNPEVAKKDLEDLIAKFNRRTKQMAENLKAGTLYDFLIQRVPKEQ